MFMTAAVALSVGTAVAQENLKELREKPDTRILNQDTTKDIRIKQIVIPIPKLGLEVNYWKHWSKFGINANQATFSDNWSAGGVNSIAVGGTIWHKSEYNKDRFNFTSEIDLRYGKQQVWDNKKEEKRKFLAKKNNDRIFFDNKLAYKFTDRWAVYFALTIESQFDVGYKYDIDKETREEIIVDTISAFMAPGYFTESLGLEYKPDNTFSLRLGTGTARQTLLADSRIAPKENEKEVYGVQPGKKFRNDLAFQITANLDRNLSKNLNLKARYNLFADYKDITDPDHRLDATLTAKVTSLVNVTLTGILVYRSQESKRIQYSQALALGLIYALPR